jgi:hypothetical protein
MSNITSSPTQLTYRLRPPLISPALYLIGPLKIYYSNESGNFSFEEIKAWTIAIDQARYIFKYYIYWRGDRRVPVEPYALCRGQNYTFEVIIMNSGDTGGVAQSMYMRVRKAGEAVYSYLPAKGWNFWGGDSNPHSLPAIAQLAAINDTWKITPATADLGEYQIDIYLSQQPGYVVKYTNVIDVAVRDCSSIALGTKNIRVISRSGEKDFKIDPEKGSSTVEVNYQIPGDIGIVSAELVNYDTTSKSANVTLEIFDTLGNKFNWFITNQTQSVSLPGSTSPPPFSNTSLIWQVYVPDDAPSQTYVAKITVKTSDGITREYTQKFSVKSTYVVIFNTQPDYVSDDETFKRGGTVCNFGDFNITANITDKYTGEVSVSSVDYPTGADTTVSGEVRWYNIPIATSQCWRFLITYKGSKTLSSETMTTEVIWVDPERGIQGVARSKDITRVKDVGAIHVHLGDFTSYYPNTTVTASIKLLEVGKTTVSVTVHSLELFIPPGYNNPRGFTLTPDPGYPYGSKETGWYVRWSRIGAGSITIPGGGTQWLNWTMEVDPNMEAGGKSFVLDLRGANGAAANVLGILFHTDMVAPVINKPLIKTVRYYNTTPTEENLDFPSSFACGAFNTKLQVFNKGNLPLINSNITENKQNISVTHPGDLQFSNFVPSATFYNSTFINWGGISFTVTGKDNSKNYSYLISVPYQTNGTFRFQAIPTNGTFAFLDEPYDIFIACGASLTITTPSFSPTNPFVNQPFNASSIITNFGPGNASNVIAVINYTGPGVLEIRNATGDLSNVNYLGTIELNGIREAKWNITANTAGTYTICIRANATENSTEVMSCNDVLVSLPPATIEMENPLVISKETGTSTGSWGFNFTFNVSVRVTNSENDVQVCSYFSKTGSEPWRLVGCDVYPAPGSGNTGDWRNFTFEFDADCSDIGSPVFVKFNATNNAGTTNSTSNIPFTITKDTVFLEDIVGNNTETRRGKTTTLLALRVRDKNNTLITNLPVTFYVTLDGSIYDSGTTNSTNESAYANYYFQAKCSPKYQVGYQKWKAVVSNQECYFDNSTESFVNLSVLVTGDIILSLDKPDGTENFTQEEKVIFIGATTDDCNDALTTTVRFFANKSSQSFECPSVKQVGANAYTCDWQTDILTPMGWYNVSMFANKAYHYDNSTANLGIPGLFYLYPVKKLEYPTAVPTIEGWGYPNWNFSVVASSGDSENVLNVSLYMGNTWPPTTKCEAPTCVNQTPTECFNCINTTKYWYRNFSATQQGYWYYQFKMDGAETSQVLYVTVEKDDVNISYVEGNNSFARYQPAQAAKLVVRVYDLDAQTYNLNPNATVTFRIKYPGVYDKVVGTNTTNASGYAEFYFVPDCSFNGGDQYWYAQIDSSEPNYKPANSTEFNISLDVTGCVPTVQVQAIYNPREVFIYRNFTVNASITTIGPAGSQANDVNVSIILPEGWQVDEATKQLGTIPVGTVQKVWWNVNATSYGEANVTVNATSSNAGNHSLISDKFVVYKLKPSSLPQESLPFVLEAGKEKVFSWQCEAGNYRIANLTISSTNLTALPQEVLLRVYVYNGTDWLDILHSYKINLTSSRTDFIPILQKQLSANETGYCTIKISNIGSNDINIAGLTLEGYYNETAQIQDIQVKVNEVETTGLETSESLFNVTIRIANSNATTYSGTLWLNITNSTGYLVNYSSQSVTIPANSLVLINFTNINTSTWLQDTYSLRAYLIYDSKSVERTEKLIFKDVVVSSKSSNWMCNSTTESYNVTIYHPFNDFIQYNVTLEVPSGWSFSPSYQLVNVSSAGNYTISFNLTSSNAASEIAIVNASVTYNYPGIQKSKKASFTIQESNSIAILEVIRETPKLVGSDKVFDSRLTIHNKGCAATSGATIVKEIVSTGWTPANPGIKTNEYGSSVQLISSSVDLVNNIITWQLGSIGVNEYAVLTYQIKSPPANSQQGSLRYNVSWEDKNLQEEKAFVVQTANYTQESHLVFDLEVLQQEEYPWPEPRSAQLNKNYNYSLKVTNIGDIAASDWNVSLFVPQACNVTQVFNNGVWDEATRQITWQLASLDVYSSIALNFTANCSQEGKQVFVIKGIKDTRATTTFVNDTSISCTGANCYIEQSFTFIKPTNARYEKLKEADFLISYEWKGQNVTIGQGFVNFADDLNNYRLAWQNYSLSSSSGKSWSNYSIDEIEQDKFVLASRKIGIGSYADATYGQDSNVTIEKIAYTWATGKLFEEEQELFTKVKFYTYAPLLANATLYINGNSSLTTGGWGEEFNFSVFVRDRFGRNVTVYAWHKPVAAVTWNLIDFWTCVNCLVWTQANFTYDYQPTDIGIWEFKFNASNADGSSELSGYAYTVEKDDVDVYAIAPSPDVIVNRSEPTTTFAIRVYDRDNKSYPTGSLSKIWLDVFTYGSYEAAPPILTSSDGWINRTMQGGAGTDKNVYWCSDTSKWYLGLHSWYGGTSGDAYVKDNVTSPFNFTLKADLANSTMVAFTTNFTRGDTITFSGSVIDDCSVTQTDPSKFGLEFRMEQNGIVYGSCTTPTTGFSCSITTNENFPYGWYNVTMIAFARGDLSDKYWNGTRVTINAFFLRSQILLEDAKKIPTEALVPWGKSPFNFTVNVTSLDNEAVTVYLWMRNSTHDWWLENSTTCTNCNNFYFFTSKIFTSDSILANSWYFKFNATSATGYVNNSLAPQSFDVTKDPITFMNFGGNNSFVNRSSEPNTVVNLTAQVWDLILNQNVLAPATPNITLDQIHFFVFNGSAYVENNTEELRNYTDFIKQFNPDCSFIPGARYWNVSVSGSSAYEDNTTTGYVTLIVNVIGDLNATYIGPTGLVEYEIGSTITFSGNVTDECGNEISGATVEFRLENATHVKYICTSTSTSNPYTCSFDTTGKDVGIYNVTMVASKPYYNNATDFEQNALKIKSTPRLRAADVTPRSEGWTKIRNFTVNVTDNPGDTVTVYLWQRHPLLQPEWQQIGSAQTCTNCLNTVLWWSKTYSCSDVSPVAWEFKFNATDTEGNRYETTLTDYVYYASGNSSFFVEKDNVLLEYVAGNEVNVTLEQEVPLVLRVYDIDNSSYVSSPSAIVSYNLTKEGIGSSYYTLATNTTNASGYVVYYFKPDSSFLTTKQNWLGFISSSDSCYQYNSSSVFNVTTWTNAPQFANVSVDIITQGWGIARTFNVSVYDQNLTATVYLWRAKSLSGPWILMNSSSYTTPGSWQSFSFYQTFSCEDQGTWYFKFNASNSIGNKNSTPEVATNNFTLTQDIILLEDITGINSIANRSGNQVDLLGVRVRDLNGTLIPNLMVNFTIQLSPGVWGPVYGNLTNESGYAVFYFNPGCSPKYEVGDRIWKAYVAEETSECYAFNTTQELNLTIMGDIILEFSKPDGSVNYTQEQVIPFLGATTDDCGDALTATVRFYANQSAISYNCTTVTQVGANAYTCDLPTSLQTSMGWYNATMMANRSYHYDNSTVNFGIPGLFYLFAKLKVEEPTGLPKQQGWGYSNWNFSVKVSSGHPTQVYNTSLLLSKVPPPTAKCDAPTCLNQTPTECLNCINDVKYWYRNFSYTEIGRWYYRYELDGTYSSFDAGLHYVDVTKIM